ncbi:MAG: nucleotidyltransferase domain-containing protein, partial [Candidatus Tectomicrobia bacterium]|nr:nucleotidyltransferase domain-containing protein [Candidatus Tectomicrobia bacterium]
MIKRNIDIPEKQLAHFCQRWQIDELALFGSVLRDDFDPDSDLDILVTFAPEAEWSLLDHVRMEQELASVFGRNIDLLSKRAVEQSHNPRRRQEIFTTAEVIYVSR